MRVLKGKRRGRNTVVSRILCSNHNSIHQKSEMKKGPLLGSSIRECGGEGVTIFKIRKKTKEEIFRFIKAFVAWFFLPLITDPHVELLVYCCTSHNIIIIYTKFIWILFTPIGGIGVLVLLLVLCLFGDGIVFNFLISITESSPKMAASSSSRLVRGKGLYILWLLRWSSMLYICMRRNLYLTFFQWRDKYVKMPVISLSPFLSFPFLKGKGDVVSSR